MDGQQKPPVRPSGIPRLASRLPLPTSSASRTIKASPSREKLQADPGLNTSRLRRPSEEPVFKKPLPKYSAPPRPRSSLQPGRDVSQTRTSDGGRSEGDGGWDEISQSDVESLSGDAEFRGRARPSLSERTMETLAQIPPSPASSRKSSFFNATSPMRSPSRQSSVMSNYSRSPSRSSSSRQQCGSELFAHTPSAMRLPSRSRPSLPTGGAVADSAIAEDDSPSKPRVLPVPAPNFGGTGDETPKASKSRPQLSKGLAKPIGMQEPSQSSLNVKKTRKTPAKLSSYQPKSSAATPTDAESNPGQQSEMEARKAAKSSSTLRESIAKAKAAAKAAAAKPSQPPSSSSWDDLDTQDPFNQRPKDSNKGLLRKRIDAGRTSGNLNIAAMSLAEFPEEVMTMYDFDPDSTTDWYESVDLVKFIAADNEFKELPDHAFPDVDPSDPDLEDDSKGNQFGGLETLDLHGNLLQSLPLGFRRLQRLQTLNLSNNKLSMEDIQIVTEMTWIRDLRLARNELQGALTPNIRNLINLEILDLHENALTDLPDSIADLTSLRVLNVSNNRLNSLPFDALQNLPLKEIGASKNKLQGTLIPAAVGRIETLRILDVSGNALLKLAEHETLELPNLQTLTIGVNRMQCLPNMTSWQALLTLSAEDNNISDFPEGFTALKQIRNVDFTGNSISKLDERIGLMESLVTFRIANNPLRERKFLGMETETLKRDLRNRCEPEPQDTDEEGSVATQFTLAPETPAQPAAWQLKSGGVLDRSYTDTQDVDLDQLERLNFNDVRCLYLQHNQLRSLPVPALSMLAGSLVDLDLSHNPMGSDSLSFSSLNLPNLQNLNLSATGLTALEPILDNLVAPSLTYFDVSYNRLTGNLPTVRRAFPNLIALLAADNQLEHLEFEAVQGLQVLDVGNNNISSLPPKIGLLRSEGSSENWGGGSALKRLEVAGNSFRVPRWQIVAKGTDAILEWLKDRITVEELAEWEPEVDETF
ncbi:leucine-rich repeat protein [Aspergillus taichungensis]|uniref:Leucine-rich repeat protein n=1 Tax=Aspergillus taichungensis TaxID=482145 RepID=A0A2J5HVG5_9EURO|nr:leucine-rich repeat protein [Aspergillus taichungensis]